jgi:hypothetical protein
LISLWIPLEGGCRGGPDPAPESPPVLSRDPLPEVRIAETLPKDLNDAGVAAKLVAVMQPISSPGAMQEIELHGSLLRFGVDAVREDWNGLIEIEPPGADLPRRLNMTDREFLLRVLAELADRRGPLAWTHAQRGQGSDAANSPRVLSARIVGRSPESASIEAELTARSPTGQGWRQQVTASWDGLEWIVKTAGLRLSW